MRQARGGSSARSGATSARRSVITEQAHEWRAVGHRRAGALVRAGPAPRVQRARRRVPQQDDPAVGLGDVDHPLEGPVEPALEVALGVERRIQGKRRHRVLGAQLGELDDAGERRRRRRERRGVVGERPLRATRRDVQAPHDLAVGQHRDAQEAAEPPALQARAQEAPVVVQVDRQDRLPGLGHQPGKPLADLEGRPLQEVPGRDAPMRGQPHPGATRFPDEQLGGVGTAVLEQPVEDRLDLRGRRGARLHHRRIVAGDRRRGHRTRRSARRTGGHRRRRDAVIVRGRVRHPAAPAATRER